MLNSALIPAKYICTAGYVENERLLGEIVQQAKRDFNLHIGGYGVMGFKGTFLFPRPPVKIHLESIWIENLSLVYMSNIYLHIIIIIFTIYFPIIASWAYSYMTTLTSTNGDK